MSESEFQPFKGLSILGIVADNSACSYYRVINPCKVLEKLGATVELSSRIGPDIITRHEVIIVPRQQTKEVYELIRTFIWDNKLFVYDIDDDLDHVTPENPAFRVYRQGRPEIHWVRKVMGACQGVTVTTPELQKWYSQANENIHCLDNYIDYSLRDWKMNVEFKLEGVEHTPQEIIRPDHRKGKFVIGYSGGDSHKDDFAVCAGELKGFLDSKPNAHLVLYTNPKLAEYWVQTHKLDPEKVEILQPVPFTEHPAGLFGMDVHLAPIQTTQFNLCKSSLKVKEAMASGNAVIASNVGPYARFHHETQRAFILVGQGPHATPRWSTALNYYYENPEILERTKERNRNLMVSMYSLEANIFKWPNTWRAIRDRSNEGIIGPPTKLKDVREYMSYKSIGRNDKCPLTGVKYKKGYAGAWG